LNLAKVGNGPLRGGLNHHQASCRYFHRYLHLEAAAGHQRDFITAVKKRVVVADLREKH